VIVKANHEGSDEIEFSSKIREGTESVDSLNYAMDTEKSRNFAEHGQPVYIKTKSGMTEQLRNVEEVSCAAAEIQNPFRSRQIELKLANPAEIDFNPTLKIEIFRPVRAGICDSISLANLIETGWVDCSDDPFGIKREAVGSQQSERMLSRAGQTPAIYQLSNFVAKSHLKIDHSL